MFTTNDGVSHPCTRPHALVRFFPPKLGNLLILQRENWDSLRNFYYVRLPVCFRVASGFEVSLRCGKPAEWLPGSCQITVTG